MPDYETGLKREVAEVKFLIHDLRVEKFINEVLHFHVTLNTELEIYSIGQAQILHEDDVRELRARSANARKSFIDYTNSVRSFSPDATVLANGKRYIQDVYEICELILDPLWGRVDRVLSFLPDDSRSVLARNHYRNCIHWICGVYYRIEHFLLEAEQEEIHEDFDIARDVSNFTQNVIHGYIVEKSSARVELQVGPLDSAVISGNRHRFRRMYFNLVMNAVDAMSERKVGVLNISATVKGDRVLLSVKDTGRGMSNEKIDQLLTDRESLDGELHSLGFVFVRRTVADYGGEISIESEEGRGTTVTVALPLLKDGHAAPARPSRCEKYEVRWEEDASNEPEEDAEPAPSGKSYGQLVYEAYRASKADFPGSIFALAVTEEGKVDFFTHRPYEPHWNITHEDLAPMFYLATLRGRIEEDAERNPVVILKAPQVVREYFEFKELREEDWSAERFVRMVHDEYVRAARTLIETGLPPDIGVEITDRAKFFPDADDLTDERPFPLSLLAGQQLSSE